MPRNLKDSVVVITGASSGIGRAAAYAFAEKGSAVVLAARRAQLLEEAADDIRRRGGTALAVPTDVTDEGAVRKLARRAVEQFGRIDVWVNNAGVYLAAPFEDAPLDAYRRVIDTDLFGVVYGCRAALPIMREQGEGIIINNSSLVAEIPMPYTSAYVAAKVAVRGLGKCLRQELAVQGQGDSIHVCTLMPATIDTPFFQHAANYTGRAIRAMPPVYPVDTAVEAMLDLAEDPRPETFAGSVGWLVSVKHTLAPHLTERAFATAVDKLHFADRPAPPTPGNLFEPMLEGSGTRGGWTPTGHPNGRRDRHGLRKLAVAGAVAVPAILAWRAMQEGER
jgi:NAD(P)-dependent dehydrogenase (short-subunit alcohol dehydrogenase family)